MSQRVVVSREVGQFLRNKKFNTAREKISLFAALHAAERDESNPLILSEEDYNKVYEAITSGAFVIDTGYYYVNVALPLGKEEFLYLEETKVDKEGNPSYVFAIDSFEQAKRFTREEIETMVPEPYRTADYIMMENIVRESKGLPV